MGSHSVLFCIVISRNASSSYSDLHINDYELAAFRDDQPVRLLLDFGLSITASGLECGVSPGGCWVLICEVRSGGMDLKGFFRICNKLLCGFACALTGRDAAVQDASRLRWLHERAAGGVGSIDA